MQSNNYSEADFDWLANVYKSQNAINHPSELHGLMFGELAGGVRRNAGDWLQLVLDHMGLESFDLSRHPNLETDLERFYQENDEAVEQDSSAFQLLLPDDDYDLSERIESMALWVRGFLEGIALSASDNLASVGPDLQEILRDLVEISQIDARVESSEEGEREFFEICEYVRVGVLNIYAEFNLIEAPEEDVTEGASASEQKPTLH